MLAQKYIFFQSSPSKSTTIAFSSILLKTSLVSYMSLLVSATAAAVTYSTLVSFFKLSSPETLMFLFISSISFLASLI